MHVHSQLHHQPTSTVWRTTRNIATYGRKHTLLCLLFFRTRRQTTNLTELTKQTRRNRSTDKESNIQKQKQKKKSMPACLLFLSLFHSFFFKHSLSLRRNDLGTWGICYCLKIGTICECSEHGKHSRMLGICYSAASHLLGGGWNSK